ncbi:hypothetical protein [Streptomyces sp. NPDC093544]|uniref:hypothetical protein n=1 Tax=Streptomyces sp. NPDC093544 TaxID=3155200 RepID=UPI00341BC3F8
MPDDGTKDPTRRDESRTDPTRSDPTRSDPMKGRAHPAPGEASPAREFPTGQKSPLGEDAKARRTDDPVRPTSAPASGTASREGVRTSADEAVSSSPGTARGSEPDARRGTSGTGSREGAGVLDRETGDSATRDSAARESETRDSAARDSATRASADREGKGGTAAHARPATQENRQLPDQDHDTRLLPQDECDKFELRLRHAVGGFVDGPRDSVAEADQVLEELAARFSDAVTRRRSTLRTAWQQKTGEKKADEKTGNGADTEQLRIALRDYREVTERLLRF